MQITCDIISPMTSKKKIKVAVLRGGPSSEYDVSLKTGAGVLKNLPEHYEALDILIDKKGVWHVHGMIFDPKHLDKKVDVVFNAMHGEYGEDGTVQRLLEQLGIPFTGSGSLASAIGMNKVLAKKAFIGQGIKTPVYKVVTKEDFNDESALEIYRTFPQPCVIKPVRGGSSVATSLAKNPTEIHDALSKVFAVSDQALIEECIKGKEATCGVLEDFRDKDIYPLLPIEIIPKSHQTFFDFEAKYSGENGALEICPGNFTKEESETIQKLAALAHKSINAKHYSRTDFIIHPKRGIYILEINTLPGLTPTSLMPKAMEAIGSGYGALLDHLIQLALKKKK